MKIVRAHKSPSFEVRGMAMVWPEKLSMNDAKYEEPCIEQVCIGLTRSLCTRSSRWSMRLCDGWNGWHANFLNAHPAQGLVMAALSVSTLNPVMLVVSSSFYRMGRVACASHMCQVV